MFCRFAVRWMCGRDNRRGGRGREECELCAEKVLFARWLLFCWYHMWYGWYLNGLPSCLKFVRRIFGTCYSRQQQQQTATTTATATITVRQSVLPFWPHTLRIRNMSCILAALSASVCVCVWERVAVWSTNCKTSVRVRVCAWLR